MDKSKNEKVRELILMGYIKDLKIQEEMWQMQYRKARSKEKRNQLLRYIEELQFIVYFIEFIRAEFFSKEFLRKMFLTRITGKAEAHKYFGVLMRFMDELRMQEW